MKGQKVARKPKLKEFRVKISDTITYSREATIVVRARDEEHAEEIGQAAANSFVYPKELVVAYGASLGYGNCAPGDCLQMEEEQSDNTPWEVEVEDYGA